MALFAQDLPVRLVPKEVGIALVRHDVIHNCCGFNASLTSALNTKRVNCQKTFPGCTPSGAIAATSCRSASLIDLFAFLNAMLLASTMP
jgi:hypothetical protein